METFQNETVLDRLKNIGRPDTPWPDYPSQHKLTPQNIPELIQIAVDEHTWEEDGEDPAIYRNIHAYRALGQLHAAEALPALIEIFRWVDEYNDDWTAEDLPEAIGLIGPAAVPLLSDYIANNEHGLWARAAAVASLTEITKTFPEAAPDSAAALTRTLSRYEENDPKINAELIYGLAELRQPETYTLVEQAYRAKRVDLSMYNDWEDFQVQVGLLEKRTKDEWGLPIQQAQPMKRLTNSTAKKEKAKRKQEKQSRQKNRKKK